MACDVCPCYYRYWTRVLIEFLVNLFAAEALMTKSPHARALHPSLSGRQSRGACLQHKEGRLAHSSPSFLYYDIDEEPTTIIIASTSTDSSHLSHYTTLATLVPSPAPEAKPSNL